MITGAETAHLNLKTPTIYLEGRLPLIVEKTAAELGLRDNQIVQATAESKPDALRLHLKGPQQGQFIDLPKDLPAGLRLSSGDNALFRVQVLANGSIMLRPLQAAPAPTEASATPPAVLPSRAEQLGFRPPDMQALAQLLKPGMLDSLLQGLSASSSPAFSALQQWLKLRPGMAQLSPEKLQQAMHRSGFMTENLLTQGLGAGLIDLKSVLRQLLRSGTDKDSLIGDSLDDIESRQLMANDSVHGREWVLSMMLPFADAEPVAMRLVRSRRQPGQEKPPLVIHLHTRNRDLGEVWLQTRISQQTQVDMVMWALREDVVERAKSMASNLEQELDSAGLHMTRLQIIHGQGPKDPLPYAPPEMGSLLDVHT
ncbi:MAG: hypothetical protein AAB176_00980 [Pseudomonadota bacterium]|jgi:hypothetical protein